MHHAYGLRVPKSLGHEILQTVKKLGIIDINLRITEKGEYLIIPLTCKPSEMEINTLKTHLNEIVFSSEDFSVKRCSPRSLVEALEDRLPSHLLLSLPKSLDIIGRIAIVEVSPELESYKRVLGEAIISVNKRVETVLAKTSAVEGELRLRKLEVIAGSGVTETIYKEHGCTYYLDPIKTYFSPRLSQEHLRIAQQVRGGEVIVDMFTGVGPFAIQIGKTHTNVKIYAIDLNPNAVEFLKKNITINKVDEKVIPILGNAREVIDARLRGVADRVIMNLPERALEFVDASCMALKADGGIVNYYVFKSEPNVIEKALEEFKRSISDSGRRPVTILNSRLVRQIAPHKWHIALDIHIR